MSAAVSNLLTSEVEAGQSLCTSAHEADFAQNSSFERNEIGEVIFRM